MAEFREQMVFLLPKDVLVYAIEDISKALIADAKRNYGNELGFYANIDIDKGKGTIITDLRFFPYIYRFEWQIRKYKEGQGYLVSLVGRTPGKWYEFLLDVHRKIKDVVSTQWNALINFGIGFRTAFLYLKATGTKKRDVRHHVQKARKSVDKGREKDKGK
jgi:hypothetical protein